MPLKTRIVYAGQVLADFADHTFHAAVVERRAQARQAHQIEERFAAAGLAQAHIVVPGAGMVWIPLSPSLIRRPASSIR